MMNPFFGNFAVNKNIIFQLGSSDYWVEPKNESFGVEQLLIKLYLGFFVQGIVGLTQKIYYIQG